MTVKKILTIVVSVIALIILLILPFQLLTSVEADEIVVHQSVGGSLTVWTSPGIHWQGLGKVTVYKKSAQLWFKGAGEGGDKPQQPQQHKDESISVRFNDNGKAWVSGSLSFDLPLDQKQMLALHEKFGSMQGIEARLIRPTVVRSVYMSGPLMSSRESAGERRNELINFIGDQASRGVYKTESKEVEVPDLLAGEIEVVEMVDEPKLDADNKPVLNEKGEPVYVKAPKMVKRPRTKKVMVVEPIKDKKGQIEVQEASAIAEFGIRLYNITLEGIQYDAQVQAQIDAQQKAIMDIQTQMANAKAADQKRLTVEKEGAAKAAQAKWDQEVKKAQAITEAEQKREVAKLDLESAKLTKAGMIERAEGEAQAKKLVMDADGALEKKLQAWVEVQKAYAAEIGKQRWVPEVVIGNGNTSPSTDFMQMLQVKAAKDLALDMRVKQ